MERDDINSIIRKASKIPTGNYQVEFPQGVGNRSLATIKSEQGKRYFIKRYNPSSAPAYSGYDARSILFNIDSNTWEGNEPRGGGEYEFQALRTINDKLSSDSGRYHQISIPKPIEYIDDDYTTIMSYLGEGNNLREYTFPYSLTSFQIRVLKGQNYLQKTMSNLAAGLYEIHDIADTDSKFDMTNSISHHCTLAKKSSIPNRIVESIEKTRSFEKPEIPVVYCHGDFVPRNVLVDNWGGLSLVDWNLMIHSHPFVDVHRMELDLWRWATFPAAPTDFINELRESFIKTYLMNSNIPYYGYQFTRLNALIRFYHLYIDCHEGLEGRIYNRMTGKILEEVKTTLRYLETYARS